MAKSNLMKMSGELQRLLKVPPIPPRAKYTKAWAYLKKGVMYGKETNSKRDA